MSNIEKVEILRSKFTDNASKDCVTLLMDEIKGKNSWLKVP